MAFVDHIIRNVSIIGSITVESIFWAVWQYRVVETLLFPKAIFKSGFAENAAMKMFLIITLYLASGKALGCNKMSPFFFFFLFSMFCCLVKFQGKTELKNTASLSRLVRDSEFWCFFVCFVRSFFFWILFGLCVSVSWGFFPWFYGNFFPPSILEKWRQALWKWSGKSGIFCFIGVFLHL